MEVGGDHSRIDCLLACLGYWVPGARTQGCGDCCMIDVMGSSEAREREQDEARARRLPTGACFGLCPARAVLTLNA
ncbi:uncharacterized protein K452DRAFT_4525 [Aplosporella prunicola CBS 121167]|uniref:Uncharacterized protein n=1 Tax=Aplosporella prunicola CBS 121167 TaxID=1176127 RepID=A0A6A6BWQ1_9PEZI|nr:uncharacterized protein K452DRAFT_4525 [Aplosporella prunicola CBS 121167]KAF2147274.1 hypothetical protein K452DRAFT_4525 [Aplosporella prunicola CBS 121167]